MTDPKTGTRYEKKEVDVRTVDRTGQTHIHIIEDTLKLALHEHSSNLAKQDSWQTPLGLCLSIMFMLCTTEFKKFIGVPAEVWYAFTLFCLVAGLFWLFKELKARKKAMDIDELVEKLCERGVASKQIQVPKEV